MTREVHDLTVKHRWYAALASGDKTHEIRRLTRDYQRGDVLCVTNEEDPSAPPLLFVVTHVITSAHFEGIAAGYAVLSLKRLPGVEGAWL